MTLPEAPVTEVASPPPPNPITFVQDEVLSLATRLGLVTLAQAHRIHPKLRAATTAQEVVAELLRVGLINAKGARLLDTQSSQVDAPFPGYQLRRELGRGGMGVVYEATHERLDRRVALKVVESHLAPDEEYLLRFEREARILARLNHPNIVQVYDYGQSRGRIYIALEFVDGRDLGDLLETEGSLEPQVALSIALQAARGLEHASQAGIIHRDVKPANLLLQRGDSGPLAKVADLGLARTVETDGELTRAGTIMGTPAYMAPEQSQETQLDHRADIYALGATLYHSLTGSRPFEGNSLIQMMLEKQTGYIPDPRRRCASLSDDTVLLLDRMLARLPEHRYPGYAALIEDLQRLLRGEALEAEPLDPTYSSFEFQGELRPSQRLRRVEDASRQGALRPALLALLALALCAATIAGAVATQAPASGTTPARVVVAPPPVLPSRHELWIQVAPPEGELELNGVLHAGSGASRQLLLPAGTYQLRLTAPGYHPLEREVRLDKADRLNLALAPVARALREEGNLRLTRLPQGVRRLPPLLNLRGKGFDRDWQQLGEWALRRTRQDLAQGKGGLVGVGGPAGAATATRLGFHTITKILKDNGAAGWRLRWEVAAAESAAFEVRTLRLQDSELVVGRAEGRSYLGLRSPKGLRILRAFVSEAPSGFQLDWDGEVASASLRVAGTPVFLHSASRSGAQQTLALAVTRGEARFHDFAIHPLMPPEAPATERPAPVR